jgi:hypothetical protein
MSLYTFSLPTRFCLVSSGAMDYLAVEAKDQMWEVLLKQQEEVLAFCLHGRVNCGIPSPTRKLKSTAAELLEKPGS